jgi:hypothetical protein
MQKEMIVMEDNININLEQKGKVLSDLETKYQKLLNKQVDLFNNYLSERLPIFKFIKKNKFYFRHPKYKYLSSRGPILGYDNDKNLLYVYDMDTSNIIKINMFNNEVKDAWEIEFFKKFNFEDAIEGLIYNGKLPDILIEDLQKDIARKEELLNKYKIEE